MGAAKFAAENIWYQLSNIKVPDGGTGTSIDGEWWLLFPFWHLVGCCYFVEASGRLLWMFGLISRRLSGTMLVRMPRERRMTRRKEASDLQIPRHNLAHCCCAKFCHSNFWLFLISPSPSSSMSACDRCHTCDTTADAHIPALGLELRHVRTGGPGSRVLLKIRALQSRTEQFECQTPTQLAPAFWGLATSQCIIKLGCRFWGCIFRRWGSCRWSRSVALC